MCLIVCLFVCVVDDWSISECVCICVFVGAPTLVFVVCDWLLCSSLNVLSLSFFVFGSCCLLLWLGCVVVRELVVLCLFGCVCACLLVCWYVWLLVCLFVCLVVPLFVFACLFVCLLRRACMRLFV